MPTWYVGPNGELVYGEQGGMSPPPMGGGALSAPVQTSALSAQGGSGLPTGPLPKTRPGPQETLLDNLLKQSLFGGGGSPVGRTMFRMAQGKPTAPQRKQFRNELERSNAAIQESFGTAGARFGTDLTDTLARNANQANVAFRAMLNDRALQAMAQILGLGQTTAGLEFGRSEAGAGREFTAGQNALDRALQEFLGTMGVDPAMLLEAILTGGLGG